MVQRILFICIENAGRSQMAEGFAKHYGEGAIEAFSASSKPAEKVNPLAVEVMKEKGIDISRQKPRSLLDFANTRFDLAVTMGCEETCPVALAKRIIDWQIPDPKERPIDFVRQVQDEIESKVKGLLHELGK